MPENIRLSRTRRAGLLVATAVVTLAAAGQPPADPWRWLESVDSTRALTWVHEQNARTLARYSVDPLYRTLYPEALSVLDSASRVPEVSQAR
jgi:prolyl oligopeptidase